MSADTVREAFVEDRGTPGRLLYRDRNARGSLSVGAAAYAGARASAVSGMSRGEGGPDDRGGDMSASSVPRGRRGIRPRAAGTAVIGYSWLRWGLAPVQRRR